MAVLSDKSIRERMAAGQLVINGEVQSALHCAYEFSASTMFKGGASTPDDVGDEPSLGGHPKPAIDGRLKTGH